MHKHGISQNENNRLNFKNGAAQATVDSQLNFPSDFMYRLSETSIQLAACLLRHTALYAISEAVRLGL
jgi:hypothetical protein